MTEFATKQRVVITGRPKSEAPTVSRPGFSKRDPFGAASELRNSLSRSGSKIVGPKRTVALPFDVLSRGSAHTSPPAATPASHAVPVIMITVNLEADDPAVIPFDPALHGSEHRPGLPVVEAILDFENKTTGEYTRRAFSLLRDAQIRQMTLRAEASDLRQLSVVAAGAEADPSKPFAPFGPRPSANASLIVGSSEIFSKPLAKLTLHPAWHTVYTNEEEFFLKKAPKEFLARPSYLQSGRWDDGGDDLAIGAGDPDAKIELPPDQLPSRLDTQSLTNPAFDTSATAGFLRLALSQDFGHAEWPAEQARASIALAQKVRYVRNQRYAYDKPENPPICEGGSEKGECGLLPMLPYEPVLDGLSAGYITTDGTPEMHRLLAPLGTEVADGRLLPELGFEGALYIGIADLAPPEKLTLLVQVQDGSGDPLLPVPKLAFHQLDGTGFKPLKDQDVDDKTLNFTTSGVIGLALSALAPADHRIMPEGLTWVRISAPSEPQRSQPAALNHLLAVVAQAGRVTFTDQGNDLSRLVTPLPAGSIAKQVTPEPALKTAAQPFDGFGGRPVETAAAMDTRVAERLRHKGRAVTMWDVEALVLDAFPQVWRAKCLGLTRLRRDEDGKVIAENEVQPGAVTLVTVPALAGSSRDPLRPYSDQATLTAIHAFLKPRLSPFVNLEVANPRLEEVKVKFNVRFAKGIADLAFYALRLNDALVAHLTPWATGGGEIAFGGKLWRSRIIDFLDSQPEVDFVTEVDMYHKIDISAPDGSWTEIPLEVIEATTARSILVSARVHEIAVIDHG